MSDNLIIGLTQADLNLRLIQNDDEFRKQIGQLSEDVAVIKNTVTTHLEKEKQATNTKLGIMAVVIGAGSSILAIFI